MGVLTEVDMAAFAAYCQSYARWKEAQERISSEGSTFETDKGYQQQTPWVGTNTQRAQIRALCGDCMIFCKSRKSAERSLKNITPFIEGKLFLKVNREKTCVSHISKVKYLGYSFYNYRGKCRLRVHPKSVTKMKNRIRELTNRSNGWGNEYRALKLTQYIRGWVYYFRITDMKKLLKETDEWLRHKIRAIYWKQCKKVRTKYRELKKLGVDKEKAWICANIRNGNWYCSGYFVLQTAFNNKKLRELGYPTFA